MTFKVNFIFATVLVIFWLFYLLGFFHPQNQFFVIPYSKFSDTLRFKYEGIRLSIPAKDIDYNAHIPYIVNSDKQSVIRLKLMFEELSYPVRAEIHNNAGYCLKYGCEYGSAFAHFYSNMHSDVFGKIECRTNFSNDAETGLNLITKQRTFWKDVYQNLYFEGDSCSPRYVISCKNKEAQKLYHCESTISFYDSVQIKYSFGIEDLYRHRDIRKLIRNKFLSYSDATNRSPYGSQQEALDKLRGKNLSVPKDFAYDIHSEHVLMASLRNGFSLSITSPQNANGNLKWGELTGYLEELKVYENTGSTPLSREIKTLGEDPIYDSFQKTIQDLLSRRDFSHKNEICLENSEPVAGNLNYERICSIFESNKQCVDLYFQGNSCRPSYYLSCDTRRDRPRRCRALTYTNDNFLLSYQLGKPHIDRQLEVLESWRDHLKRFRRQ